MRVIDFLRRSVARAWGNAPEITWSEATARADWLLAQLPQDMMHRFLAIGTLRYNSNGEWHNGTPYVLRAQRMLGQYKATRNRQFLVDALNYCLLEWVFPGFERTFFKQTENPEHEK